MQIGTNPIGSFYLPDGDDISSIISSGRIFDEHVIELIQDYSGKVALDVGANVGQMSICMSRLFEKVYAFEANPYLVDIIKRNLELNQVTNVEVIQGVVWDIPGVELPFPEHDGRHPTLGSYGVIPHETTATKRTSITIDSLNLNDVDFMKFDIQGADLRGMKGARQTLTRCKPDVLFEYEPELAVYFDEDLDDYHAYIKEIDYRTSRQISGNILMTPI